MTLDLDDLERRLDDNGQVVWWRADEGRALLAELRRLRAEKDSYPLGVNLGAEMWEGSDRYFVMRKADGRLELRHIDDCPPYKPPAPAPSATGEALMDAGVAVGGVVKPSAWYNRVVGGPDTAKTLGCLLIDEASGGSEWLPEDPRGNAMLEWDAEGVLTISRPPWFISRQGAAKYGPFPEASR